MTMSEMTVKNPKGVRLDHISKIYQNPKTGWNWRTTCAASPRPTR